MDPRREELRRLVEDLLAEQVPGALADLRARGAMPGVRPWPPAWFGMANGSATEAPVRVDEILGEGLGRRPA